MAAEALPVAFWVVVGLSLVGLWVDVSALRVEVVRGLGIAALALKGLTGAAFAGWWLAFKVLSVPVQGFMDLAALVSIMLLAVVLLAAALVCDGVALRRMRAHK